MLLAQPARTGVPLRRRVACARSRLSETFRASDVWLSASFLVLAWPVLHALWVGAWSTAQGAQGPIVLVSGLWLLAQSPDTPEVGPASASPASDSPRFVGVAALSAMLLMAYVFSLTTGFATLAWAMLIGLAATLLYLVAGWHAVATRWFALVYLLFAAPVPTRLLAPLADFLATLLSAVSVEILWFAGIDASHSGLDLFVDQYELRMADACAGLNSLTSLFAIGMFYIYVRHRGHWPYALALCLIVPPIAVLANLLRIVSLLLVTHFWGDGVAQGLLHTGAGLFMFVIAVLALLTIDTGFARLRLPERLRV